MTPKKCYHEWNLRILQNLCYISATNFSITVWGVPYAQSTSWPGKLRRSIVVNVTHTLDVAEILRPPIQWVSQKFWNHSYTGCIRNYAAIYTLGAVEILRPFIQWMWQKFCNDSYTGCCRNSATTHTLDVAEILRPHSYTGCRRNSATIHDHTHGVAEILRPIIHWVLQKFCNHSDTWVWQKICDYSCTGCRRNFATTHRLDVKEIPRKNTTLTVSHIWISIRIIA